MSRMLSVVILSIMISATIAGNPLGNCEPGRAVAIGQTNAGQCGYPSLANVAYTTVNQAFYANGLICGACFEVTGPLGTTVVQVTDQCLASSDPRCGGDRTNFGINMASFANIVDNSTNDIIYDLSYRQVTCNTVGNVQMTVGSGSVATYFSLTFLNFRSSVVAVEILGSGWSAYEALFRQGSSSGYGGSAVWQWNKNNRALAYPLKITIVGATSEVLTYSSPGALVSGAVIDFGSQFHDVVDVGGSTCPMTEAPLSLYSNGVLGYGWDDRDYFTTAVNDTNSLYALSGETYSYSSFASPYGAAQFTRLGGFLTGYFSNLTFWARTDSYDCPLRVYFGIAVGNDPIGVTTTVNNTWQYYSYNLVSSLNVSAAEYHLVFQNYQNNYCHFYFADIGFLQNATTPNDTVVEVTTTGYLFNTTQGVYSIATSTASVAAATAGTTGSTTGGGSTGGNSPTDPPVVLLDTAAGGSTGNTNGFSFNVTVTSSAGRLGVAVWAILVAAAAFL